MYIFGNIYFDGPLKKDSIPIVDSIEVETKDGEMIGIDWDEFECSVVNEKIVKFRCNGVCFNGYPAKKNLFLKNGNIRNVQIYLNGNKNVSANRIVFSFPRTEPCLKGENCFSYSE